MSEMEIPWSWLIIQITNFVCTIVQKTVSFSDFSTHLHILFVGCFFGLLVRLFWARKVLPFILLRNLSPIDAFETGVSFRGCEWKVVLAWDWNISELCENEWVLLLVKHPIHPYHKYLCRISIGNGETDLFIDSCLTLCSSHLPPSLLWIFLLSSALVASI